MKHAFGPRPSRIRTPGLRPRCTAVRLRDGATCDKPVHDDRQSHRWSNRKTTRQPQPQAPKKKKFISFAVRKAAAEMIDDSRYRRRLLRDLRARRLRPSIEVLLWHLALGKPKEMVEHTGTLSLEDELRALTPDELYARALAVADKLKKGEDDE